MAIIADVATEANVPTTTASRILDGSYSVCHGLKTTVPGRMMELFCVKKN